MTQITIRERSSKDEASHNADLIFDHGEEFPIIITNPFSEAEEEELEWYFEKYIRQPLGNLGKARKVAETIAIYGERLFDQVFAHRQAYARYQRALKTGMENLAFEVIGSPDFHRFHWESLKDPDLPHPLALQAPIVRRNITPQSIRAKVRESPTINLLVVTARPRGALDVGYRTISRPLVEGLRQAGLRVRVDILRPGTYRALVECLETIQDTHGTGYYHVIHFDVHGALCTHEELEAEFEAGRLQYQTRYGRGKIEPYERQKAFLFLEGEKEGLADPVEAKEMADLLRTHQVPIAILNACQSGRQVGAAETSLGSRLVQAGAQMALAMGYSITITAAELMMRTLYEQLFAGQDLSIGIRRARWELFNRKSRRALYNQTVDLEDWFLPVVYQNIEQVFDVRKFTPEEQQAYYAQQARRYRPPETAYGFVGRDLDVLRVEQLLLRERNLLLVRGMGGAGKTTLLHHLGAWWQATGFVDEVFYFGYDEQAWTRQRLMRAIARGLMEDAEYHGSFLSLGLDAQQALLTERLRAKRHLLVLDNLESITRSHLAVGSILPQEEREALQGLLADLVGGRTLVLMGSRGREEWLAPGTYGENVYELSGLDPDAVSTLVDRVLARNQATKYREDPDLARLLNLLDGYPLAIEVMLGNLARQTPTQVLEALQAGDVAFEKGDAQAKTESILLCIDYSYSDLSSEARGLLACLAPFTGVVDTGVLEAYTARLKAQPALADLPYERWEEVLQEAVNWGLVSPHPEVGRRFLRLQPTLPYFLRSRLAEEGQTQVRMAIETAFRELYDDLGAAMANLLRSADAEQKQLGYAVARLEYENLATALDLALEAQVSIQSAYIALSSYLEATQDQRRDLQLGETILDCVQSYPPEALSGQLGAEFISILTSVADRQLEMRQYAAAEASLQKALSLSLGQSALGDKQKAQWIAGIYVQLGLVKQERGQWAQSEKHYHQAVELFIDLGDRERLALTYGSLGIAAQAQRRWAEAEGYYRQALEIFIDFNDRHYQAVTYHQLGTVAQEQRQWAQAEQYYQNALEIKISFDDRHLQASTYHQLGRVAQAQGQWTEAERYYQHALAIHEEFNDRYSQANTYSQLGRVAQEQGRWTQVEAYFQQALEIYTEFNDRYAAASAYHQLGLLAEKREQWAEAQNYLLRALEILHAYEDANGVGIALRSLARVWQASADADLPTAIAGTMGINPDEIATLLTDILAEDR